MSNKYTLGIDIGSTTVKIAILDEKRHPAFRRLPASFRQHPGNTGGASDEGS